jgi:beta-lactamase class A
MRNINMRLNTQGWWSAGAFLVLLSVATSIQAQSAPPNTLQEQLTAIAATHHGKVALYALDLKTNRSVGIDANKPVQTASVIKLAILYHAMAEVRAGHAAWEEKIVLKPGDVVGGSGMLHLFDTPLTLTLKDVLTMMVVVSDNTATNLAIDRFGIDAINARVESLGLRNTHLYKKIFKPTTELMPADQPKFGLGKTTPLEMAKLMSYIGGCNLQHALTDKAPERSNDPQDLAVCGVALSMLKNQFYRETIPRYLETGGDATTDGVAIASKTGSLDAVRNDVAIVSTKSGPLVLSIFTYDNQDHGWTVDNGAEVMIARIAKIIVDAWSPQGLDGKQLVPGLGLQAP